ncbi:MAG: hypothetical protein ABWY93_04685 [Mycobacterium sp.]
MADHTCVLCRVYRPDGPPRVAEIACPGDRARLHRDVDAIATLYARLAGGDGAVVDDRWYELTDQDGRPLGQWRRRDPVAHLLPAGDVAARSQNTPITGTRTAPVPINVDAVDLTAPARRALPLGEPGDQVGYLPVATVLDGWARHVRDWLHPDFHLPPDDVAALSAFLARHLDETIDGLPGVLADLAVDVRALCGAMRVILGEVEPTPQPILGVRCEHCRTISSLVPWPTGEYVECRMCGQLYSSQEREAVAKRQLAAVRRPRRISVSGFLPGIA